MLTDLELWSAACARDSAAITEVCRLAQSIARTELRRKHARDEEIEDLAQEVVASVLAYLRKGGELRRDVRGFLKYRTWGVLSVHRKKMRLRRNDGLDAGAHDVASPEVAVQPFDGHPALRDCIQDLPDDLRVPVELRYTNERPTKEIAARLGISENAVHIRIYRAVQRLRDCLRRKGVEDRSAP